MNKNKQFLCAALSLCCNLVFAGDMGREIEEYEATSPSKIAPFVSIEGGYAWNTLKGFDLNVINVGSVLTNQKTTGWTGRAAAGLSIPTGEAISLTSEMAWGYYGRTSFPLRFVGPGVGPVALNSVSAKTTLYGFDLLAGIYYVTPYWDVFLKGGAIVENAKFSASANLASLSAGRILGTSSINLIHTQVLPEIKLGGSYHFNEVFSIFAAWTHAFGSPTSTTATFAQSLTEVSSNLNAPSFDAVTIGLQFYFI